MNSSNNSLRRQSLLGIGAMIGSAMSKGDDGPVEVAGREVDFKYDNLGRRVPFYGPGVNYMPSDPLTKGDGFAPGRAQAQDRLAPAWFPYGGGEVRFGTDYTNVGSAKAFYAAAETLSAQGDGRLTLGVNTVVGANIASTFDKDTSPLSIGFLVRLGTTSSNVNPLAGQRVKVSTAFFKLPWAQTALAVSSQSSPNREVAFTLDTDGLGKPLFIPWATQNFQSVNVVLAYPGAPDGELPAQDGGIAIELPVGLVATTTATVELVTNAHPDLDRILETIGLMTGRSSR